MEEQTHNATEDTTEDTNVSPAEDGAWLHRLATSVDAATPDTPKDTDVSPADIGAWLHYLATSILDMLPPGKSLGDFYALGEDHFVRELYDLAKMVAIQDFAIYEQCTSQDLDAAEVILYAVPDEIAIKFWEKTRQIIDEVGYSPLLTVINPALLVEDTQTALRNQYV